MGLLRLRPVGYRTAGNPARPKGDPNEVGHIYDFFAIDYTYPNDVHALSMCRQISNCANSVSEAVVGTKGRCQVNDYNINGKRLYTREQARSHTDPYVQEHTDLIASIRDGKPLNELRGVAESTLSAIMGRMSTYTGKLVTWEDALNTSEDLMPKAVSHLEFGKD